MKVAVVIPTIEGREDHLATVVAAYMVTAPTGELIVERGHKSCGAAWIAGAARAEDYDYLHFGADDLEPTEGWLEGAVETVDAGYIPAPLVYLTDGTLESAGLDGFSMYRGAYTDWQVIEGTTVPFLSWGMWAQISAVDGFNNTLANIHYCTDIMISAAGRKFGHDTVIRTPIQFIHHNAQPGRNYDRVPSDTQEFIAWAS